MKKFFVLLATMAIVASLPACVRTTNNTQVANSVTTNTEEWYHEYQKKLDKSYQDAGWMVLQPGAYIDPITHQIDIWGGDTGIFYDVAIPGLFDTELWQIYYNDSSIDMEPCAYDTDEFFEVQDRAMKAWEAYRNGKKFTMTDEAYDEWFESEAASYDEWAWTQKYQR